MALGRKCGNAVVNGLALHDHSRKAAERVVVHTAVFVLGVVTQAVEVDFNEPFFLGTQQNGLINKAFQHFRQYADDVNAHIE